MVTDKEWMEFTKVDHKLNKSELWLRILVFGLLVMHAVIVGAAFV